jgi:NAD(P)-dependent dehydrogenase (short-subunit alcohol dehydrogenase family)
MGTPVVLKLNEKVALITGGSRGIGAAIAKRLAADGASVATTYAKEASAASAVVKAIERRGGKAVAIQADAADVEAVKGAVEKTVATFGRLDVLVNNAGTAIPKTFEETTLDEMDRVIDINVRGTSCSMYGNPLRRSPNLQVSKPSGGPRARRKTHEGARPDDPAVAAAAAGGWPWGSSGPRSNPNACHLPPGASSLPGFGDRHRCNRARLRIGKPETLRPI